WIETREVTRGNLQSNGVPFLEAVARGVQIDGVLVDATWFEKPTFAGALAVTAAYDAVGQVASVAGGFDVDKLGREVDVAGARTGKQHHLDGTSHLHVHLEWRRGVHEHIRTVLHRSLIVRTQPECSGIAAIRAALRRDGPVRVGQVDVDWFIAWWFGAQPTIAAQ